MSEKSQAIVQFIASLLPLYTDVQVEGRTCALSLIDGTVVAPVIDPNIDPADDDGWLTIYWQGDSTRRTEVSATLYASQAVLRYIELRSAGLPPEAFRREREGLAQHFVFKTGATLYLAEGYVESAEMRRAKKWGGKILGTLASVVTKHLGIPYSAWAHSEVASTPEVLPVRAALAAALYSIELSPLVSSEEQEQRLMDSIAYAAGVRHFTDDEGVSRFKSR